MNRLAKPLMLCCAVAMLLFGCQNQTTDKPMAKSTPDTLEIPPANYTVKDGEITSVSGTFALDGVYPHLTTYTHGRANQRQSYLTNEPKSEQAECGIGAVVPWGGKLYMINYAAHEPKGSEHKLYIVDEDLTMEIFQGSVGGTPAARMVHQESNQLFIGHYAIDSVGNIRVIDIKRMPGRLTAVARHLKDPANMVYYYDMEGMLYEVNVHTLEPKLLYKNPLPGYHGKGAYTSQGKLILANNGEPFEDPTDWQVPKEGMTGYHKRGILAEFDGDKFTVVERSQFTDLTTKNGIYAVANEKAPLWAIGWNHKSLRLKVMENGQWQTYLLPKAAFNNDPHHGWFTEWPRIREINNGKYLMDMHGMFFDFPGAFSHSNTAGLRPIGSHLRYVPDFAMWKNKLVLATDETSIQGNPLTGQAQSNLWFGQPEDLKTWGPANGYGAIWLEDEVTAQTTSSPYHFAGYQHKVMHMQNFSDSQAEIEIHVDAEGNNTFTKVKTVKIPAQGYVAEMFDGVPAAEWIKLKCNNTAKLSAVLHYTNPYPNATLTDPEAFKGLAPADYNGPVTHTKLFANHDNFNLTVFPGNITENGFEKTGLLEVDKFTFTYNKPAKLDTFASRALENELVWKQDEASVVLENTVVYELEKNYMDVKEKKYTLRLPTAPGNYNPQGFRAFREIESERGLANIAGIFYEVPFFKLRLKPMYKMMRPVATHGRQISDYNTWNGLLMLSGVKKDASGKNILKDPNTGTAVWMGGVDEIWKLGKPVGEGGVWKNTPVKAGQMSDLYIMTGFDKKTLELTADKPTEVSVYVYTSHYSDKPALYKTFTLKANETLTHTFPDAFSAHWVSLKASNDCIATAWFKYQ